MTRPRMRGSAASCNVPCTVVVNAVALQRVLTEYVAYYLRSRTHLALDKDAPISRIDLLVCRNTLMYFNAEAQSRILSRLHFALADVGVLFHAQRAGNAFHDNLLRDNAVQLSNARRR